MKTKREIIAPHMQAIFNNGLSREEKTETVLKIVNECTVEFENEIRHLHSLLEQNKPTTDQLVSAKVYVREDFSDLVTALQATHDFGHLPLGAFKERYKPKMKKGEEATAFRQRIVIETLKKYSNGE